MFVSKDDAVYDKLALKVKTMVENKICKLTLSEATSLAALDVAAQALIAREVDISRGKKTFKEVLTAYGKYSEKSPKKAKNEPAKKAEPKEDDIPLPEFKPVQAKKGIPMIAGVKKVSEIAVSDKEVWGCDPNLEEEVMFAYGYIDAAWSEYIDADVNSNKKYFALALKRKLAEIDC